MKKGGGDDGDEPEGFGINTTNDDSIGQPNVQRRGEFILVNPRNITTTPFPGRNLNTNPYMPFNNSMRRLIVTRVGR